ncbi:ABC transporter substrate-binding protein [Collinsella tanakaei]|uniref:ABC transporter substrate-binding protein n=1 Tax=Collinsella tanakaei TaxID=626935 RepID=UPI00195D5AC6|nr:ABC transporter substrate-binding protein [Collinsella tanakaei]MBM6756474.1 ABC transporter substrate-binding protein [Collinsella tanakaei]
MAHFDLMMDRRALLGAAAAGLGALALGGCSTGGADEGSDAGIASVDVVDDSTIVVGIDQPVCLDPYFASAPASAQAVFQLFDPLTRYDFETGALTCLAAESYRVSEDQQTFTFTLRDATFHNGDSVRASDFKRAWERLVSPESAAATAWGGPSWAGHLLALVEGYNELRSGAASSLSGVSCPDDRTLTVKLTRPYAEFPYIVSALGLAPVPTSAEDDPVAFGAAPVGNGPFMVAAEQGHPDDAFDLVRFEEYLPMPAQIERVRFSFQEGVSESYRAFESDDLMVSACPFNEVDANAASWKSNDDERLQLNSSRHMVLGSEPVVSYLVCNTTVGPLNDAAIRRALSMAIDRDALSKRVFRDARMPAYGIVPPDIPGYREEGWAAAEYDVSAATDALDALYSKGSDGERDCAISLLYSADSGHKNAMELIAEDFEAVGVTCELEEVSFEELYERLEAGTFQLARIDWTPDVPCMDNVLFPLFHSSAQGGFNFSRYANQRVDELIDQARATASDTERIARLREAEDVIAADMPVIPYIFGAHAVVGSRQVEKLLIDPYGYAHLGEAELA